MRLSSYRFLSEVSQNMPNATMHALQYVFEAGHVILEREQKDHDVMGLAEGEQSGAKFVYGLG